MASASVTPKSYVPTAPIGETPVVFPPIHLDYLRNRWYVAGWSPDLEPGQIISRTICEEPIAIFRRHDGVIAAIADQCSHRFVPLSMGRVCEGSSNVECPYHGLQFDETGACVVNPHGSGRIPSALHVKSYPIAERHTLIWVWMGSEPADEALIPDFSYLDEDAPGTASKRDWIVMEVDYRLVVDNLMDLSHAAFLHRGIIGNEDTLNVDLDIIEQGDTLYVNRTAQAVEPTPMFDLMFRNDGQPADTWSEMRWDAPANLRHDAGITVPGTPREEGLLVRGTHLVTPSTPGRCYYHFCAVRICDLPAPADNDDSVSERLSIMRRFAFDEQDRPILEAQQRAVERAGGPDKISPVMLSIDTAPLRARRILSRLIDAEQGATGADGLDIVHLQTPAAAAGGGAA